ncbi:MAG: phosphate ABC transporter substrate-binding/OmpA family protein [Geminicoccales bacterium]
MRQMLYVAMCLSAAALVTSTASEAEVVISSKDGKTSIRGTISSFEDGMFTISTSVGPITLDANLVDCSGEECPEIDALDQLVRIAGPQFLLSDLMPDLIRSYAEQTDSKPALPIENGASEPVELFRGDNQLVTFETQTQSPNEAFQALLRGDVEVVLSDRSINEQEIEAFLIEGMGDLSAPSQESIVAQDGIVALVSGENAVKRLSVVELMEIFAGNVTNWAQLGGSDLPINVYLPDDDGTLAETFELTLLEPEFLSVTAAAERLPSLEDIDNAIANDPGGIGITSLSTFKNSKPVELIASCGVPIRSSRFAVKAEDYPFSRRIYMYVADRELPSHAQKFIDHAKERSSRQGLNGSAFLGLDPEVATISDHGHQLAYSLADPVHALEMPSLRAFTQTVFDAERLSVTFRFNEGSSQLDNKSIADAERLLSHMSDDEFEGREVLLIGFTDSIGSGDVNRVLSTRRAQQVLDTIDTLSESGVDRGSIQAMGFGEAYPVACDTTEFGRELNRRVEVWIR